MAPKGIAALIAALALVAVACGTEQPGTFAGGSESRAPVSASPSPSSPSPSPASPEPPKTSPSPPGPSPRDTGTPGPTTLPDCGPPLRSERPPEGMSVTLSLAKTTLARGEPVDMTLRVRNNSSQRVRYQHSSGHIYDFWVSSGESTIWLWSSGQGFTQALVEEDFTPGDERVVRERWKQDLCNAEDKTFEGPPPPGRYTVRALWTAYQTAWWSNPVLIEIR